MSENHAAFAPAADRVVLPSFVVRVRRSRAPHTPVEPRRRRAWARLARELPMDKLDAMTSEAVLGDLPGLANKILKGQVRGRLVVDVNG